MLKFTKKILQSLDSAIYNLRATQVPALPDARRPEPGAPRLPPQVLLHWKDAGLSQVRLRLAT